MSGVVKRVWETCDVTKVTYYMYSCDTCCKIREMMEMNDLDCAKCQKSRKRDKMGIMKMLMRIKTKCNRVIFSILKTKNGSGWNNFVQ